jgi:hypothetical protein
MTKTHKEYQHLLYKIYYIKIGMKYASIICVFGIMNIHFNYILEQTLQKV